MKISKNVTFVNLFAFILIFITSCVPPTTLAPRRDVLSFNSIQLYGLTENDLKNVQFFLDKKLVIIGETTALDKNINISFYDENVEEIDFSEHADLIAISVMLTCQMPRAWEIADRKSVV